MTVYIKSKAAIAEITGETRTLSGRHRQVLILVDGARTHDEIAQLLRLSQFNEVIEELLEKGLIIDPQRPKKPLSIELGAQSAAIDEDTASSIRQIIVSSSDEHLGIMGKAIKQKISATLHLIEIKACVSQWHMAMRESKSGKIVANALLAQIQTILQPHETTIRS